MAETSEGLCEEDVDDVSTHQLVHRHCVLTALCILNECVCSALWGDASSQLSSSASSACQWAVFM